MNLIVVYAAAVARHCGVRTQSHHGMVVGTYFHNDTLTGPPGGFSVSVAWYRDRRKCNRRMVEAIFPGGPFAVRLRVLVPKTIPGMVFGICVLKWAVSGPFGIYLGLEFCGGWPPQSSHKPQKPSEFKGS